MKQSTSIYVACLLASSVIILSGAASAGAGHFVGITTHGGTGVANLTFTPNDKIYGTFNYGGQSYGVGNTVDLNLLANDTDAYGEEHYTSPNATAPIMPTNSTFRIYKQKYSTVIGNNAIHAISYDGADREFVRVIAGRATKQTEFNGLSGSLTYSGKIFNHINTFAPGSLTYTIDTAAKTGSGRFEGLAGKQPDGAFILNGTLDTAKLQNIDGQMRVKDGGVTFDITRKDEHGNYINSTESASVNADIRNRTPKYDLGVFGPNAEEIAGHVHEMAGPGQQRIVGGFGFAGKKSN